MVNIDTFKAKKEELLGNITDAIQNNDADAVKASLESWQDFMVDEFKAAQDEFEATADKNILAARGVRQLTSAETKYYTDFIATAKNEGVITNILQDLPLTVIKSALDDIKQNHPLLSVINFRAVSAAIKWVLNAQGGQSATWGDLNSEITKKLSGAIEVIDMTLCKLSAYMYCTQDMLDLGPSYVDAYVRATLVEALSVGLENGIVDGSGLKEPAGMTRNTDADFSNSTGYPRKDAIKVADFSADTYGNLLSRLAKTRLGNPRPVTNIVLIVNPVDYFTRVMPATTALTPDGTYKNNIFPYPTNVIQSVAVPEGHAVFGIASNYFMGIGTAAGKSGKIESSDEFKFLDDLRTYKIKLHGNGKPMDMNSFLYLDITDVELAKPTVAVTDAAPVELTALSIGNLTLSPAFSRTGTEYTATASAASNKIDATAKDSDATIVIKNGNTTVNNGGTASWTTGANKVTVTVTNGGKSRTYTVVVTKGE